MSVRGAQPVAWLANHLSAIHFTARESVVPVRMSIP
jgi:hypothetical protein